MIRTQIHNDIEDARTRNLGALIVRKYNVPARNQRKLARAVQLYAQDIKFFREYPEVIAAPWVTAAWGIGDCDDKSRMIAAVLRSFRMPVRLTFVTFRKDGNTPPVSHVFPEVFLPSDENGSWLPVESVRPWPLGKDPLEMIASKGYKYSFFRLDI